MLEYFVAVLLQAALSFLRAALPTGSAQKNREHARFMSCRNALSMRYLCADRNFVTPTVFL